MSFAGLSAERFEVLRVENATVIDQFVQMGLSVGEPREVEFFVQFADQDAARACRASISEQVSSLTLANWFSQRDPQFDLFSGDEGSELGLVVTLVPEVNAITEVEALIFASASPLGGGDVHWGFKSTRMQS